MDESAKIHNRTCGVCVAIMPTLCTSQMHFCDGLDVLILKLLAVVAGTFHYSYSSMVAQVR